MDSFDFSFGILPHPKVVVTRTKGTITLSRYLSEFVRVSKHPLFDRDISYLHDFREVDEIRGTLDEHKKIADFAVSIASNKTADVVFLLAEHSPSIKKLIEGYTLMASRSNRNYWIYPESEMAIAIAKVGLRISDIES